MMTDGPEHQSTLRRFYADVVADGGIVAAMEKTARVRGLDIGTPLESSSGASVETRRGTVVIGLSKDERLFLIGIQGNPGFTWAVGATADRQMLVDTVASWHAGMSLDEFEAAFNFMRVDQFARALEAGDVTSLQWAELLSADFYKPQHPTLRRIYEDEDLRLLFPVISHGVIRLRSDPMNPGVRGHILIDWLEGSYRVRVVGDSGVTKTITTLEHLIAYLRTLLSDR